VNANRRNVLLCCTLALVFSAIGCGGVGASSPKPTPTPAPGSSPTPSPTPIPTPAISTAFAYVANNGSTQNIGGSISGFRINPSDGSLAPVPGSPFKAGGGPTAIGSDPQGHFVFVGEDESVPGARGNNCTLAQNVFVLSERVDPASGTLTLADKKAVPGNCIRAITVDPSGRNVYVGVGDPSSIGGDIHGFLISTAGTLSELPGSPVRVEDLPVNMAMHPTGKFVYAATPNLTVLDRNTTTGILTVRGVFNTPKRKLALNPTGTLLVASEDGTNEVSEFHIDGNGNVFAVDQRVQASNPFGVAADPQGQFFAITEITDTTNFAGGLSLLKLNSFNGEYSKVNSAPFGSGGAPLDLAFEPTGKFVYSVFHNDGTVAGFVLDRNSSTLTAIPAKPFASGDNPVSLTIVQPR
jgi:6-phosphogluconolactonase (cycloisomerase 2 family)